MTVRVYSFNTGLNGGPAGNVDVRWESVWNMLKPKAEEGAVLVLQEVPYRSQEKFYCITKDLKKDYTALFRTQGDNDRFVNLVIAKSEFELIKEVPSEIKAAERANRYLPFMLRIENNWIETLAVHAGKPKKGESFAIDVIDHLDELKKLSKSESAFVPKLIVGDFNAGMNFKDGDSNNAYKKLLKSYQFRDALEDAATFRVGTSLDHILYDHNMLSSSQACIVTEPEEFLDPDPNQLNDYFDHALICSELSLARLRPD